MFKIGEFEFKNGLILAPMAGVSDIGFRSVAIDCGADACVTEMVSAKAFSYNSKKTLDLMRSAENEKIKIIQIFGHEPEVMAKICKSESVKNFDIIDINMGCPAPKIVNNGDGSALMKNIDLAEEIIKECVSATDKPVTVKFRLGWNLDSVNAVEFAKMCERAGASAITVHGRVREQFFSGEVDYDTIRNVVEAVKIPVIGNGDVCDRESYLKMLETGCAGVMIGRGALGNPYIFSEILGFNDKKPNFYYINKHIEILRKYFPDVFVVKHMRKHILWYLGNSKRDKEMKNKITTISDLNELIAELKSFYGV